MVWIAVDPRHCHSRRVAKYRWDVVSRSMIDGLAWLSVRGRSTTHLSRWQAVLTVAKDMRNQCEEAESGEGTASVRLEQTSAEVETEERTAERRCSSASRRLSVSFARTETACSAYTRSGAARPSLLDINRLLLLLWVTHRLLAVSAVTTTRWWGRAVALRHRRDWVPLSITRLICAGAAHCCWCCSSAVVGEKIEIVNGKSRRELE